MVTITRNNGKFKAGEPRPENAGRKKGTPNKVKSSTLEVINALNPVEKLAQILEKTKDEHLKAKILLDLLKYIVPQQKALSLEAEDLRNMTIYVNHEPVEVERG